MSARRSPAFSSADIDALFTPLGRAKALLIAVSGGPDFDSAASDGGRMGETARQDAD